MAEFTLVPNRFLDAGLALNQPGDLVPAGKFRVHTNLRPYVQGELTVRTGTTLAVPAALPSAVHSIFRLNDPTPFNGGVPAVRVYGAGGNLYMGVPDAQPIQIDSGYSGDPLVAVAAQPVGTVQPWLYIADRSRMQKVNILGTVYPLGIAPPLLPPTAVLAAPGLQIVDNFDTAPQNVTIPWISFGAGNSIGYITRVNGEISQVLYDSGTTGNALIVVTDPTTGLDATGINARMVLLIGIDDVLVQEVKLSVQPTTIAGIFYDDPIANTGACSIQPTGGLGTGAVSQTTTFERLATPGQPGYGEVITGIADIPVQAPSTQPSGLGPNTVETYTQNVFNKSFSDLDFPAGALIQIGAELVKIQNVETGRDGVQSFRCITTTTHAVGEPIVGFNAYRVYMANTHGLGSPVVAFVAANTIGPLNPAANPPVITQGGISSGPTFGGVVTGSPGGNPVSPIAVQIPNHQAIVASVLASAIAQGLDPVNNNCDRAQVCIGVAQQLSAEGCGLFRHSTGPTFCPNTPFGPIETFALIYGQSGQVVDISGPPGFTPIWQIGPPSGDGIAHWVSLGPITNPLDPVAGPPVPPVPPGPPQPQPTPTNLNLSMINGRAIQPDDLLHISLNFDVFPAVLKVDIILNIDVDSLDYTKNYYIYEADQSVLATAFQATSVVATSTLPVAGAQAPAIQAPIGFFRTGQIELGSTQWTELTWRVGDMLKIGTDNTRSLADLTGVQVLVTIDGTTPVLCQYGSIYLTGGGNPDVGTTGIPYIYSFRYRSKITGAVSNPSPEIRSSAILPRRQDVALLASALSPDPQANTLDWFRFGGNLPAWRYLGSSDGLTFTDDYSDSVIQNSLALEFDNFQPFPTSDVPRSGVCNVAGSTIVWVSGDQFNLQWAPGTQILINGLPFTLYSQPPSATQLYLVESATGVLTNATFEIPSATILGNPLPVLFGPVQGYYFGIGDPTNPGQLNWTKPNNPDAASDTSTLYVDSPSTPLQNGFVWDGEPYVFSTNDLYRIFATGDPTNPWQAQKTPCGRGLWNRWAFCLTPEGIIFLAEDGIYITDGGSSAVSLTNADLYSLFPHDGGPGVPVNGYQPPDFSQIARLSYVDGEVYFDYAVA